VSSFLSDALEMLEAVVASYDAVCASHSEHDPDLTADAEAVEANAFEQARLLLDMAKRLPSECVQCPCSPALDGCSACTHDEKRKAATAGLESYSIPKVKNSMPSATDGLREWDPSNNCLATSVCGKYVGCGNAATVSVGTGKTNDHLCESCAALPTFRRMRRRVPLRKEGGSQ